MANENFRAAVLKYGELYIEELTKQLLLNDKKATGDLIDSLDYRVIETADNIILDILSNQYLRYVDKGRQAGTLPNVDNIQRWMDARGIIATSNNRILTQEQASWAIAKSIQKNGIVASNVLKKAKASLLVNKQALNDIAIGAAIDYKQVIKEALKNLNSK